MPVQVVSDAGIYLRADQGIVEKRRADTDR
jgi:hypothetical protein